MAITLDANLLQAAVHLAAAKDVRFYLGGVFVEAFASSTRLVATDGSVLGVFECDHDNRVSPGTSSLIIPTATIALLPKTGLVQLERVGSDPQAWEARHGTGTTRFTAIDGKFPDYRRVMVTEASGEAAFYDIRLLARFDKVAQVLSGKRTVGSGSPVQVWQNGPKKGAAVTIGDYRFAGVIMPRAAVSMPSLRWAA